MGAARAGGVHTPTKPEVYEYVLDMLAKEDVTFVETSRTAK